MNFPLRLPIFTAAVLSLAGIVNAQTPEENPPLVTSVPSAAELQELETSVNLGHSTMAGAAKDLERLYLDKYAKTGLADHLMPKLIFGPGAADAKIEGELKLSFHNRRALDALALVAAAAGCRLEPIPSLPESAEDKKKPQRVVGYYVTVALRPSPEGGTAFTPIFRDLPVGISGNIGLTLGEQNGDILIREVVPGLPAAQSRAIAPGEKLLSIAEEGAAEVPAAELGTAKITEMLVGEPGTKVRVTVAPPHGAGKPRVVLLTREPIHPSVTPAHPPFVRVVEPLVDTFSYINDVRYAPAKPGSPDQRVNTTDINVAPPAIPGLPSASPAPTGLLVRIYPVAFFIKGNEDRDSLAKKQLELEHTIDEALQYAQLNEKEMPTLSLHEGTKVLIVKATAPQHEIIQQIMTSLKENEQAGAQDQGALRR